MAQGRQQLDLVQQLFKKFLQKKDWRLAAIASRVEAIVEDDA